tara:strand:+ start:3179 stop:3607 length:429 start_codon:yes stop_codon:yes gene_type:complete
MAKNNSPLDYGSWAHRDAERAKKLYAEGKDSWAHALGIDEHDADYAHHWHKDEAERGHTGNSKWADGAPTMWETGSQISKHMNHHLWGEAKREEEYIPELDHGAALKQADWGHNKDEYKRHLVDGVEKKTGDVDHHYKDYEG